MKGCLRLKKKIIIGITGSFGSGKTTVARIFSRYGAKVIDADKIAHRLIQQDQRVYKRIVHTFGEGILKKDKSIDRKKLARLVFTKKNFLEKLNQIMHPEIIRLIKKDIRNVKKGFVVLDAPLLLEAGLRTMVDKLIVVKINRRKQIQRLRRKTTLTPQEILKRINSQMPLRYKAKIADFVIDNSGNLSQTRSQINKIMSQLQ
ncbi:MAG: dephospho-CoA kinase [Candidatus Omnitrophica bacterium]|nr:dephospho-CoA kinase [Candidatus Omnitrophota bacterium]